MAMISPHFLEALNGMMIVSFLFVAVLFAQYIQRGIQEKGWQEGWRYRRAAIAVLIFITGEFLIRSSVWVWRHQVNTDNRIVSEDALGVVTAMGLAITLWGTVCLIRHFSPRSYSTWISAGMILSSVAFGVGMAWP